MDGTTIPGRRGRTRSKPKDKTDRKFANKGQQRATEDYKSGTREKKDASFHYYSYSTIVISVDYFVDLFSEY